MVRLGLLYILFFLTPGAFAQKAPPIWCINTDKTYLATIIKEDRKEPYHEKTDHVVQFYSLDKNCLTREIPFDLHKKEKLLGMEMDRKGRFACVRTNQRNMIMQIAAARIVHQCGPAYQVALPRGNAPYAAVHNGNQLRFINLFHGEIISTIRSSVKGGLQEFRFDESGKFLLYRDGSGQVYVHRIFQRNAKKWKGDQFADRNGIFYAVQLTAKGMHVILFDLKKNSNIAQYDWKKEDMGLSATQMTCELAPAGRYTLVRDQSEGDTLVSKVYDLQEKKNIELTIRVLSSEKNAHLQWYHDSLLILKTETYAWLLNPDNPYHILQADYSIHDPSTSLAYSQKKIKHTTDEVYSYTYSKNMTVIHPAFMGERSQAEMQQTEWLGYDASTQTFLLRYHDSLAYATATDIELAQRNEPMSPQILGVCLPQRDPPVQSGTRPTTDPITFANQLQRVQEQDLQNISMHLEYQSVWNSDTASHLQFLVMDDYGNYYSGLTDSAHRKIWCKIEAFDANGTPVAVKKAGLHEFSQWTDYPADIALVMDNSGSMGHSNANRVHASAMKLIEWMDARDRALIVKYDHRVEVFGSLTNDKEQLEKELNKKGYGSFNGGTSIIDAVYQAHEALKASGGQRNKMIFVITDGLENSSSVPMKEMLEQLKKSGTRVYTIAYGTQVAAGFLKGIAQKSKGGYYQVYNEDELKVIYKDVYQKSRNYYRLDLDGGKNDIRYVRLTACTPKGERQLQVRFSDADALLEDRKEMYRIRTPQLMQQDVTMAGRMDKAYFPSNENNNTTPQVQFTKPGEKKFLNGRERDPKKEIVTEPLITETQPEEIPVSEAREEFEKLRLPVLLFAYDSDKIVTENPEKEVKELLAYLKKHPDTHLSLYGHTDGRGKEEYNQKLSLKRARKVADLLIKLGVDAERLSAHAMGEGTPVASNETEAGMQQNRRVMFELVE